jgi:DNA-binding transcriptional regulator YhcF (GntR family)/DNA-binding LacI/PurR family transcriptional regulator
MSDLNLRVERPKVIWRQVADQVRSKIYNGELAPGMKLPSTAALAAQSGADVRAVHRALTDLVREGLITRTRKVGTYVRERQAEISRLGIYHTADTQGRLQNAFLRCVHEELQRQIHQREVASRIWVDQRPLAEQDTVLPEIENAARERVIEGLISTIADPTHLTWLTKLKVPVAFLGSHPQSGGVGIDAVNFWRLTFQHLKDTGCPSAGVISVCPQDHPAIVPYLDLAAEYGLKVSPDWMICSPPHHGLPELRQASFGFEAFQMFWAKPVKPQCLVVYPDVMLPGVAMAIMAAHVRVPEELHLVFHKNEGIDYFCPFPAAYVTTSVRKVASALLSQINEIYNGRPSKPVLVDHYLSV